MILSYPITLDLSDSKKTTFLLPDFSPLASCTMGPLHSTVPWGHTWSFLAILTHVFPLRIHIFLGLGKAFPRQFLH